MEDLPLLARIIMIISPIVMIGCVIKARGLERPEKAPAGAGTQFVRIIGGIASLVFWLAFAALGLTLDLRWLGVLGFSLGVMAIVFIPYFLATQYRLLISHDSIASDRDEQL